MDYVIGWITLKPGQRDTFLAASQAFVAATRAEPGVLFFELHRSDDTDVVLALETYASAEAHEAHVKSAHFADFWELFQRYAIGGRFENALGAARRFDEVTVGR